MEAKPIPMHRMLPDVYDFTPGIRCYLNIDHPLKTSVILPVLQNLNVYMVSSIRPK
jgi:hypothetical protein